jgi:hypothetical protein
MVFPVYLLWGDVVEINGQLHRFKGVLRRFRNEQALVDFFGGDNSRQSMAGKPT